MLVFYTCTCAQVRTFNVEKTKNMRMLNPEDIDHLITISGMVIRTSPLIPEMREAFFRWVSVSFTVKSQPFLLSTILVGANFHISGQKPHEINFHIFSKILLEFLTELFSLCFNGLCSIIIYRCYVCQQTKTVEIDRGRIAEPAVCPNCQTLHSMALIHNRSSFNDKQMVKLQESPDDMPPGQTPHTVVVYAHHDLVDSVQPGDRWWRERGRDYDPLIKIEFFP